MAIFPTDVDFNVSAIEVDGDFKEYAVDLKTMKLKYSSDGKNIILTGNEALKVWIYKVLNTVKDRYKAYSSDYGTQTEELIGYNYTDELMKIELKRDVENALKYNKYILGIENFNSEIEGSLVTANFKVNTIYGEVDINV